MNMEKGYCGRLAVGSVQFGIHYGISNRDGVTPPREVKAILSYAASSGISMLDTAFAYGESERVIGSVSDRFKFAIVSKYPDVKVDRVREFILETLLRLRVKSLYCYMLHNLENALENSTIWRSLVKVKEDGLTEKIGVSLYTPKQLEQALTINPLPDLVQIPYNVFDIRFSSYFSLLKAKGIEIHTRSSFLQGLFFMEPTTLPNHFKSVRDKLATIRGLVSNNNDQLAALLVSFCLRDSRIDKVIVGINSTSQLKAMLENLPSIKVEDSLAEFSTPDESIIIPVNWPQQE